MTLQGGGRKLVTVGNYHLTGRRLGKGNFAKVEEAIHDGLNYKVALKIMDVTHIKEEYVIKNLYREARILSKLCHPCIIAFFQTMQYGNVYYIVTELVDGSDLCGFIKGQRYGKLEERFSRIYARQLISAIAHMHNMGIVHRDLKMENVMLNSYHTQIKIVDFGLSNLFSDDSPLRTHCGSPEYAAPELFVAGKNYGPKVDVWSLGVILYGMVVGQLPFVNSREEHLTSQERRKKLLAQINQGISGPQRKAIALLSAEFKSMMNKLLIADSAKRFTTKELMFHAWVTEKGRKMIRSNPYKKLDQATQNLIIEEIGKMVNLDSNMVRYSLSKDPCGNVAGMYNIVHYTQLSRQQSIDCITKTVAAQNTLNAMPKPRTASPVKVKKSDSKPSIVKMKSAPPCKVKAVHPQQSRIPTAVQNSSQMKSMQSPKRASASASRYNAVETKKLRRVSYLNDGDQSRSTDKRASSANQQQHMVSKTHSSKYSASSRSASCSSQRRKPPLPSPLRVEDFRKASNDNFHEGFCESAEKAVVVKKSQVTSSPKRKNELHVFGNRGVSKALFNAVGGESSKTKSPRLESEEKKTPHQNINKGSEVHAMTASLEKPRSKSEPTNYAQPTRRYNTVQSISDKVGKQKSLLPVSASQSTPSRATTAFTQATSVPRNRRTLSSKVPVVVEKSTLGTGDNINRPLISEVTVKRVPTRKHYIDEPIARSIAGYVANNVPNKLQPFEWMHMTKEKEKKVRANRELKPN